VGNVPPFRANGRRKKNSNRSRENKPLNHKAHKWIGFESFFVAQDYFLTSACFDLWDDDPRSAKMGKADPLVVHASSDFRWTAEDAKVGAPSFLGILNNLAWI